jgi:protease-4
MKLCVCISMLCLLAGCGTPSFLITPVENTYELQETVVQPGTGGIFHASKVAIIPVEGTLMDARATGLFQAGENPLSLFVQQLDAAAKDDSVKAVVLRVNSPGGSVTTSDTMYDALVSFRQKTHKPVVASCQEVCASGAYYTSCGADKIVANPTSLVGSIGVIFESFDVADAMQKLGIIVDPVKSAELKDMGSPFKHQTPHEREVMQAMVDEYFARFKGVVVSNRPIKDQTQLPTITDGRVFSGARALDLGLVDQLGNLDDAVDLARKMSNSPGASVVMFRRPYGYAGSIYADSAVPQPQANTNTTTLKLPFTDSLVPDGFYYLWQP